MRNEIAHPFDMLNPKNPKRLFETWGFGISIAFRKEPRAFKKNMISPISFYGGYCFIIFVGLAVIMFV